MLLGDAEGNDVDGVEEGAPVTSTSAHPSALQQILQHLQTTLLLASLSVPGKQSEASVSIMERLEQKMFGIVPTRAEFCSTPNSRNAVLLPNCRGIDPEKRLFPILRYCKLVKSPISVGMVPLSELPYR